MFYSLSSNFFLAFSIVSQVFQIFELLRDFFLFFLTLSLVIRIFFPFFKHLRIADDPLQIGLSFNCQIEVAS